MRRAAPEVHEIGWEGGTVAAFDWGGDGTPLVLLHPNGFCGGLYEPLATTLAGQHTRPIAIDLPGHGHSTSPTEQSGLHFATMASAVVEVLDALGIEQASAVGGSLGGGVAILADRVRPGAWERLLLAEAVAFPPVGGIPREGGNPMAEGARPRRRVFPDRASMVAAYARRPPLSELAPEALDAYVRWGTREVDGGVELRCDPEVERQSSSSPARPPAHPTPGTTLPRSAARSPSSPGDRASCPTSSRARPSGAAAALSPSTGATSCSTRTQPGASTSCAATPSHPKE